MMFQCCLFALMIAHCVSSPDQTKREDFQLSHPFIDDIHNTSQIDFSINTIQDLNNFDLEYSGIPMLNVQDIYDENNASQDDKSGAGNDPIMTAGEMRYDDGDNRNVILYDSSVRILSPLNGAESAAESFHVSARTELNNLEAEQDTFESVGSQGFLQHHFEPSPDSRQQLDGTEVVQLSSTLLTMATTSNNGNSSPTTGLTVLTVLSPTAVEVSLEKTSNVSLPSVSTQRTIQHPMSNVRLAVMEYNKVDASKTVKMDATGSYNDQITTTQKISDIQQSIVDAHRRNDPKSIPNFHPTAFDDTIATVTYSSLQRHRTINSMNLNPTTPSMVVKPVGELRKLLKSTGPILNYVFDHHPPYYKSTYYNTRYNSVSWVRRKKGDTALQLLTVGRQTYSGDPRYHIEFQYPNNWRLKISRAHKDDEGVYECQISTHPPKVIVYFLFVNAPEVAIVDEEGVPLYDKYYEVGSTIKLMCKIRHISMLRSVVYWIHNENTLNHDTTRGGISVKTNLTDIGANSTLFVAKVKRQDSGTYMCSIGPNQHYSISVHVLNGTANPFGIYQRSCAFSIILQAVDLWFVIRSLFLFFMKVSIER
uniref:Ig-like domain-containing protein n=1 Tax=Anopheles gambiae TaxID=7165 RepID=A0ABK8G7P2_ANOGA